MKNSFKLLILAVFVINGYAMQASDDEELAELNIWNLHSYSPDRHITPVGNNSNIIQSSSSSDSFHAPIPDSFDGCLINPIGCNSSLWGNDTVFLSSDGVLQVVDNPNKQSKISRSSLANSQPNEPVHQLLSKFKQEPETFFLAVLKYISIQEGQLQDVKKNMNHNLVGLHDDIKQGFDQTVVYLKALNQQQEQLKSRISGQKRKIDHLERTVVSQDEDIRAMKKMVASLSEDVAKIKSGDQSNRRYNTRLEPKNNSRYND